MNSRAIDEGLRVLGGAQRCPRRQILRSGSRLPICRKPIETSQMCTQLSLPDVSRRQLRGVSGNAATNLECKMRGCGADEHRKLILGRNSVVVLEYGHDRKASRPHNRKAFHRNAPDWPRRRVSCRAMSRPWPEPLWQ